MPLPRCYLANPTSVTPHLCHGAAQFLHPWDPSPATTFLPSTQVGRLEPHQRMSNNRISPPAQTPGERLYRNQLRLPSTCFTAIDLLSVPGLQPSSWELPLSILPPDTVHYPSGIDAPAGSGWLHPPSHASKPPLCTRLGPPSAAGSRPLSLLSLVSSLIAIGQTQPG